jgi:hypothetical protein
MTTTAAAAPRTIHNWSLPSEDFSLDPAAEVSPPEVDFGGCDEAGTEAEGLAPVGEPATDAFSLVIGSTSGAPGFPLPAIKFWAGLISP